MGEGAKRPEAAAGKRSRMVRKSEATETPKEQKITTEAEGAKRPGAGKGKRSRMVRKSEATKKRQEQKITTMGKRKGVLG